MFLRFADWFVYQILNISKDTHFGSALHFFIYDTIKILFLLFAVILIISFLRDCIDVNKLKSYIEKQPKFAAHLLASMLGAVTPFCSCSSIPLFIGFIEARIPFGVGMSFLITSPMINEIAILVLAGVVGIKITVLYIITGIIAGVAGGYILEKLGCEKYLEDYLKNTDNTASSCSGCSCNNETMPAKKRLFNAFNYSKDLMKRIWLFVIIGVGAGAILHGYVPSEFFIKYMGGSDFYTVPLAVAAGIPLYADVTTIIPVAQVLINKGAAIGTVLAFMMAIAGLSLPEMIILSKVMKKALLIRFAVFMFIVFTIAGYFYNLVIR